MFHLNMQILLIVLYWYAIKLCTKTIRALSQNVTNAPEWTLTPNLKNVDFKKNHVVVIYLANTGWQERRPQYRGVHEVVSVSSHRGFWHSDTLGCPRTLRVVAETSRQHIASYSSKVLDKYHWTLCFFLLRTDADIHSLILYLRVLSTESTE